MSNSRTWSFLKNKQNRKVVSWLGGGLIVVATGTWPAFVYFHEGSNHATSDGTDCTIDAEGSIAGCGDLIGDNTVSIKD